MGRPKMLVFSSHLFCPSSLIDRTWNQRQFRQELARVWLRNQDSPKILFQKIQNPEAHQLENLQCAKQIVTNYIKKRLLYWKLVFTIQGTDSKNLRRNVTVSRSNVVSGTAWKGHGKLTAKLQIIIRKHLSDPFIPLQKFHFLCRKTEQLAVIKSLRKLWVASHETQKLLVSGR